MAARLVKRTTTVETFDNDDADAVSAVGVGDVEGVNDDEFEDDETVEEQPRKRRRRTR